MRKNLIISPNNNLIVFHNHKQIALLLIYHLHRLNNNPFIFHGSIPEIYYYVPGVTLHNLNLESVLDILTPLHISLSPSNCSDLRHCCPKSQRQILMWLCDILSVDHAFITLHNLYLESVLDIQYTFLYLLKLLRISQTLDTAAPRARGISWYRFDNPNLTMSSH